MKLKCNVTEKAQVYPLNFLLLKFTIPVMQRNIQKEFGFRQEYIFKEGRRNGEPRQNWLRAEEAQSHAEMAPSRAEVVPSPAGWLHHSKLGKKKGGI